MRLSVRSGPCVSPPPPPPTQGPDLTLNLIQVFINVVHQNEPICAGMGPLVPDNGTNQFLVKFYPILM